MSIDYSKVRELADSFKEKIRNSSGEVYLVTENETALNIVCAVHMALPGKPLPNDWIYRAVYSALDNVADEQNTDRMSEWAENETDVYYQGRLEWLASNAFASDFVSEVMEDYHHKDIFEAIGAGQYRCLESIYQTVIDELEALAEVPTDG